MHNKNNTSCKNCVFAKYDNYTQIGCHLNMIEKFSNIGVEILEAYDNEKEFYVISNRNCHFFRPEKWGQNETLETKIQAVQYETNLAFNIIIFVDHDYKALKRSLASAYRQTYKPSHITIVRSLDSQIWPSKISDLLSYRNIKWRIENLRQNMSNWKAFHLVQKFCQYPYHIILQSGDTISKKFLGDINNSVIHELKQFALLEDQPSDDDLIGSGLVIPTSVYQYFYFKGNVDKTFVNNVKDTECQIKQQLIYTKKTFCQAY